MEDIISHSKLVPKYNQEVDRESAYEILNEKIAEFEEEERQAALREQQEKMRAEEEKRAQRRGGSRSRSGRQEKSMLVEIINSPVGRTVARELTRGILGVFGLGGRRRR